MDIALAVRITISIPFLFTTIKYKLNDHVHTLTDGALTKNCPVYYYDVCEKIGRYPLTYKGIRDPVINEYSNQFQNTLGFMIGCKGFYNPDVYNYYDAFLECVSLWTFVTSIARILKNFTEMVGFMHPLGVKYNYFENVVLIDFPMLSVFQMLSGFLYVKHETRQMYTDFGYRSTKEFMEQRCNRNECILL